MPEPGRTSFSYIPFPDQGTAESPIDPALVERFFDQRCDYRSTYRIEQMREWTINKAYYESVQWVRLDVGYDPRRAVRWTEVDPQRKIPKPITNEVLPIFDSAVSRIAQRQSKPSIRSRAGTANSKAGTRLAQDVCEWHFDHELEWSKTRRDGIFKGVLYGTFIWKSYWDLDYRNLTRVGVTDAAACAAPCGFCGGTGKGPLMGPSGELFAPGSQSPSPPVLDPSAPPFPYPTKTGEETADRATPVLDRNQPPFPTTNPSLGRVGDVDDSAQDYSVAGSRASVDRGGTPIHTGKPREFQPPLYAEDTTGPRRTAMSPPSPKKSPFSIGNPDRTDPSYDFSVSQAESQEFDCPQCGGSGIDGCGFVTADKNIDARSLLNVPPPLMQGIDRKERMSADGGGYSYSVSSCPQCGAPLQEYQPTPDEVDSGKDFCGRDLGQDVPLGHARVDAISPFDIFPENEGIDRGTKEDDCDEFYQNTPRSLDWLANHFEDVSDIKPEDPNIIAQHHPILGEYSFWSVGSRIAAERTVYQNHVRVREGFKKRSRRYPLGRYLVQAGKKVLADEELYFESQDVPGLFIPKVHYAVARYLRKDGEFFGQGIITPLISLQNRINMTYSQIVDTRERHGTAGILATRGMKLTGGWTRGFTGRILLWDPDPQFPEAKPEHFPTKILNEAFPELQNATDRMKAISGEQDVDVGKAPTNVSAASGIQLLQEKSAVRNLERESELMDAQVDTYTHQMQLLRHFALEAREFMKKDGDSSELSTFLGVDLAGQTDVVIEDQASYDKRLFNREGAIQANEMGLYDLSTPSAKREMLKLMQLPLDVNEEQNVQLEDAERKWRNFKDTGFVPAVDEFEDDHLIHWGQYGKFLKSSDGIKMRARLQWDDIIHALAGWEDKWKAAQVIDQQVRQQMNAPPPMGPKGPVQVQKQPPPDGFPLPSSISDQLLWVWQNMLQKAQIPLTSELFVPPQRPGQRAMGYLAFLAVVHTHRILFEQKQSQAAAGQPQAAAPQGAATATGNVPSTASGVAAAPPAPPAKAPPLGPRPEGLPA